MRFSPTKILQGLLCTTPVLVLALAACGGGGGGSTPAAPPVASYSVGGAVSGVSGSSSVLVLRNNGGDDLSVASGVTSFVFGTKVVSGNSYNITVLTNPSNRRCTVAPAVASGVIASNVTNANVTCVPAFTIGGGISGLTSNGLVLQNNFDDNFLASSGVSGFTFSTPVADGGSYSVTVLTQPNTPARLICNLTGATGSNLGGNVNSVSISCGAVPSPVADRFAYTANFGGNSLSAYAIVAASGVLSASSTVGSAGNGPSSVAADAASHVYATNLVSNTISGFSITDTSGNLTQISDIDAGTPGIQGVIPTGPTPVAITIHPSGKFAYVVNSGGGSSAADANSVSAYSIDANGALARIDTDAKAGTQYFIPTRVTPNSIAIDPAGAHAYVTNGSSNNVTVYNIDATSGTLAEIQTIAAGTTPYSIAIDPAGAFAYVTSWNTNLVWIFSITNSDGTLINTGNNVSTGNGPRAVAIHPSGKFAYVVNSGSGDISAYNISPVTGALVQIDCSNSGTGCNTLLIYPQNFLAGAQPISIAIDSSGQYAYVANKGDNTVSAYNINASTGVLTSLSTPTSTGLQPSSVITVR